MLLRSEAVPRPLPRLLHLHPVRAEALQPWHLSCVSLLDAVIQLHVAEPISRPLTVSWILFELPRQAYWGCVPSCVLLGFLT